VVDRQFLLTTARRDSQRFPLPLTQEVLADALGLSIVHVNRTLQQLRRERLIELRSGVAILLEPELLAGIADYRRPAAIAPAAAAGPAGGRFGDAESAAASAQAAPKSPA